MAVGDTGVRTGEVWLDDFDMAVKKHIGAAERLVTIDGVQRPFYTVSIPGVVGDPTYAGQIPVTFGSAHDVMTPLVLPAIVIVKDSSFDTDGNRRVGYGRSYKVPTDAALAAGVITAANGVQGYSAYETRAEAEPINLRYSYNARARKDREASVMGKWLWRKLWNFNTINVVDSTGSTRGYSVQLEERSRDSDLSEVTVRRPNYRFTVVINGELEYDTPVARTAVTSASPTGQGF